jgi:hypothetical protein
LGAILKYRKPSLIQMNSVGEVIQIKISLKDIKLRKQINGKFNDIGSSAYKSK